MPCPALLAQLADDSYLSVQAYFDRLAFAPLEGIRDELAAVSGRPVTFGWGPRFLHSTGQFHKGGPAIGVFLQVTAASATDLAIPERPFTFGELISAQAAGDAQVLAATTAARSCACTSPSAPPAWRSCRNRCCACRPGSMRTLKAKAQKQPCQKLKTAAGSPQGGAAILCGIRGTGA